MNSGNDFLYSRQEEFSFIVYFSDQLQDNHKKIQVVNEVYCVLPTEKSKTEAQKSMPFPPKQGQTGLKLFRLLSYAV